MGAPAGIALDRSHGTVGRLDDDVAACDPPGLRSGGGGGGSFGGSSGRPSRRAIVWSIVAVLVLLAAAVAALLPRSTATTFTPLLKSPTGVSLGGQSATSTDVSLGGVNADVQSADQAVSLAAFALNRDNDDLVKQTGFGDLLVQQGAVLQGARDAYSAERAALALPYCAAVGQDAGHVEGDASRVNSAYQRLLNRIAQVNGISNAVSADRAAVSAALTALAALVSRQAFSVPTTTSAGAADAQSVLDAAAHNQATAAAAIAAALSAGRTSVTNAHSLVIHAVTAANQHCPANRS